MTDKDLQNYIENINSNNTSSWEFNSLSQKVVFCFIPGYNHEIFFIKNEAGTFVSAVQNGGVEDLHWYVLHNFRKNGYLTIALKDTILPYLLQENLYQRITISRGVAEDVSASTRVAKLAGFFLEHTTKEKDTYIIRREQLL
ncbi:MAG: hypothetical protein ACO1OQ_10775 [Rufibacter sp.]